MNKLVDSFKRLMADDKRGFLLLCIRLAVAFVFFIALLIPFCALIQYDEVVNRTSTIQLPGGWFFLLLTLGLLVGSLYLELVKNQKLQKLALLVQCLQASVVFFYGLLLFFGLVEEAKSYPEASVRLAFGFTLQLIFLALLWFTTFGEKLLAPIIGKFAPGKPAVQPEQPVASPDQPTVQ